MARKSIKRKISQSSKRKYWDKLITGFDTSAKLWLEGFDISENQAKTKKNNFKIDKIIVKKKKFSDLKQFLKKYKLTMSTVIQGAWSILLMRYSRTDDIIYGIAHVAKITKQINISDPVLPTRSTIRENESILEFLKSLQEQFEQHKKNASGFKISDREDIYQNLFHYLFLHRSSKNKFKKQKLNLEKFGIALSLQYETQIKIDFIYNTSQYTKKSILNLKNHFDIILDKIIKTPLEDITHFSILNKIEKFNLLNKWSKPYYEDMPELDNSICIHHVFTKKAQEFPTNIAVSNGEITLTYAELNNLSNRLAQHLQNLGIEPFQHIAVLMERTPALLVAMLAIYKLGAVYVPLNPKYPDDRIQFILEDCMASVILVNNHDRIPSHLKEKAIILNDQYDLIQDISPIEVSAKITADRIAYIIYTSGTTGQPKGVMIRHISVVNFIYWYQVFFKISELDRASQFASQAFDSFFCETIPFLCSGSSVHIIDDHTKLSPTSFLSWIATLGITVLDLPTAYAQVLFTLPWPENSKVRLLKIGGESLSSYPEKQFSFDIWNIYGPTEATIEATYVKIYEKNAPTDSTIIRHIPPPIGKPIANSEIYVVDAHLEPVPIGDVGELLIGGVNLSAGYLNRKELTREKFIRNFFSSDSEAKLYRTGDLVRWLEDGNIEFVGRVDHQIKIRGFRIELSEIESSIHRYPDVKEVVVLAKESIAGQKNLVAYLVPNLDKLRIPYHERCLVGISDIQFVEANIDDISKNGVAITSFTEKLAINQKVRLSFKLPGASDTQWLTGRIIWQLDQRAGIEFEMNDRQKHLLEKSINYYLATHNLMETIRSAATKRSVREALKKKLPDYMIPSVFSVLPEFPLTFNGKIDWKALPPPQDFERLLDRKYVAPRTETETIITDIWKKVLNLNEISITDNFFDIGGSSLLVSQLSVLLLNQFKISIPPKIFFDFPFIPILAEYIDSRGEAVNFRSNIQDEISHDSILNDNIIPANKHYDFKKPRGILLTGAAGFLGIFLLRELLKQTDAKIYCIIRKGEFESAAKRLIANVHRFELEEEISLSNRRIIIIDGDISLDRFGVPTELYENMSNNIDSIFHCGAQVNTMSSYTNLRSSNVQGTLEVIKFAVHNVDKAIHYISTLSAAYQLDNRGFYAEEFPDANLNKLTGGYAISKWVSERLLTQLKNRGLPVSIYRSGYILGQSDTGITNYNDSLLLLIKGCIQLGFAPNWKEKINILPVDFVSKITVAIALHEPEQSHVYHIDHPHGILWNDLISWFNNYGYTIKKCSHHEWIAMLTHITPDNALYHFLPYYLSLADEPMTPETGMDNTKRALKEMSIYFPNISDHLLQLYTNYLCRTNFYPTPEKMKNI